MKKISFLIVLIFSTAAGQFTKEGTTAAQFLKLGVGARAIGMGGAAVALVDDGSSAFWNPAGLAYNQSMSAFLMHNNWVLDINHDYISFALPRGNSAVIGFAITVLSMDEQEITTVFNSGGTGAYYSVKDMAFSLSYAQRVTNRLKYGLTAKYVHLSAYNETAQAFAFDIGSILTTGYHGIKIGMALSNFGGNIRFEGRDLITDSRSNDALGGDYSPDAKMLTEAWPLPMIIRVGLAGDLLGSGDAIIAAQNHRLTFALDAIHPNDAAEHVNMGIEYALRELVFLRAGYRLFYELEAATFGAGTKFSVPGIGQAKLDFAVVPMGQFGNIQRISLELQL